MTIAATLGRQTADSIYYPESDGNPIADNTLQYRWIVTIQGGVAAEFADNPHVFVAGDLLWYPVEGDNKIRVAPDVLVAVGRPKGERGSYLQWIEGNIAPQVVWEILSPGNRAAEMRRKFDFYERFGVEEYYIYDPDSHDTSGWRRDENNALRFIEHIDGWVSPRLGIRFVVREGYPLELRHSNGKPFLTFQETVDAYNSEYRARILSDEARFKAEQSQARAERERAQAEQERDAEWQARERLAARLRAVGIDPDSL